MKAISEALHWLLRLATGSLMELAVFNAVAGGASLVIWLAAGWDFVPVYGLVILLESVVLMLVGGAAEMSSTGSARAMGKQLRLLFGIRASATPSAHQDARKVVIAAATYTITGVLLFGEAALLSAVLY